jgi:hypothetical protein
MKHIMHQPCFNVSPSKLTQKYNLQYLLHVTNHEIQTSFRKKKHKKHQPYAIRDPSK